MSINRRKIYIGAIALQGVLLAYFIAAHFNPSIKIPLSNQTQTGSSSEKTEEQIGKVGEIGIGNVETAKFVDFNKDKTVSREFGFEKMLHRSGEQWQVEKPFMNIYQNQFQCRITADKAVVLANQNTSPPSFKEATLLGNVIAKIQPDSQSNIDPVTIYLDDIVFIGERSLFLTAGPVKIIAENSQLIGRGLELVYNHELGRIELLRIIHLETLCFNKVPENNLSPHKPQEKDEPKIAAVSPADNSLTEKYQAVFSGNVMIRTPSQIVFADDRVNITNILRKKLNNRAEPGVTDSAAPVSEQKTNPIEQNGFMEVIVTCENGLVFSPIGSSAEKIGFLPVAKRRSALGRSKAEKLRDSWGCDSILTETITYDAAKLTATASGNSELTYKLIQPADTDSLKSPVTTKTNKQINYDSKTGLITFSGTSDTTFYITENQQQRVYSLSAEQLTVDSSRAKNNKAPQNLPIIITAKQGTIFNIAADSLDSDSPDKSEISPHPNYSLSAGIITAEIIRNQYPNAPTELKTVNAADSPVITLTDPISNAKTAQFSAQKITYDSLNKNITAAGPTHLEIQTDSLKDNQFSGPVIITAQEQTTYSLSANQAVFLGDCECSMIRTDSKIPRKYKLNSSKIIIDIAASNTGVSEALSIKQITAADNATIVVSPVESITELARFNAPQIKYFAADQSIVADGLCSFNFYATDFMQTETDISSIPVFITSKEQAKFSSAENKIDFIGDCICTMVRTSGQSQNKYTLSSGQISIQLSNNQQADSSSGAMGIEYLSAEGGVVQLSNIKTSQDKLLEFSKIKCSKLDYDTKAEIFRALGPGIITVDNSKIDKPDKSGDVLSLNKKCYAFVRDFENLKYLMKTNQITAYNSNSKMLLDYLPVENGQNDKQIKASVGNVEINLQSSDSKATELSSLKAGGGITYEDHQNQFSAGQIIYDTSTSLIRAFSDNFHRCYLNGAVVDNIVYNVVQNKIESVEIKDPGLVQTNQ